MVKGRVKSRTTDNFDPVHSFGILLSHRMVMVGGFAKKGFVCSSLRVADGIRAKLSA